MRMRKTGPISAVYLCDRNPLVCCDTQTLESLVIHVPHLSKHVLRHTKYLTGTTQTYNRKTTV